MKSWQPQFRCADLNKQQLIQYISAIKSRSPAFQNSNFMANFLFYRNSTGAATRRILKLAIRQSWQPFCSTINLSTTIPSTFQGSTLPKVLRIFIPNKPVRNSFSFPMTIGFSPPSAAKHQTISVNILRSSFTLPHSLSPRFLKSLCALDELLSAIYPVVPSPQSLARKKYPTVSFVKISLERNQFLPGVLNSYGRVVHCPFRTEFTVFPIPNAQ